jgi:hypothetical protein
VHFTETLLLAGLAPPIATVGDALDNARRNDHTAGQDRVRPGRPPFRNGPQETLADVEQATSAWACWYNTRRSAGDRQQKPRPGTTLLAADPATQATIFTHNRVVGQFEPSFKRPSRCVLPLASPQKPGRSGNRPPGPCLVSSRLAAPFRAWAARLNFSLTWRGSRRGRAASVPGGCATPVAPRV